MKPGRLATALLRILAALAVLAAFVVLDWYPVVKDLGRLRRERSDLERRIREYGAMAGDFEFPDERENALLAADRAELLQSLPRMHGDEAWVKLAQAELQARAKGLAGLMVFSEAETLVPGPPGLTGWLGRQAAEISRRFQAAAPQRHFPWQGVFPVDLGFSEVLASRLLGVALEGPQPVLLDFVNRISWGDARLQIVFLRLEPAGRPARAWALCRGDYQAPVPSPWRVDRKTGADEEDLLIDPNSPLLLRRTDPLLAPQAEKRELPPAGSPW